MTKIVTLCGSSRYCDIMAVCAWLIERDEKAIAFALHLLPEWYFEVNKIDGTGGHLAEAENVAAEMDELHLRKIDLSDEIFVVNFASYIGNSTKREIDYAGKAGLLIRYFESDPIGVKVNEIIKTISAT